MRILNTKSVVYRGMVFRYTQTALAALTLSACTQPTPPATQVKVVRETVEVFKGCNVVAPPRPGPLGDIPQNSEQALAKVGAKLTEYAGPGKWAERMEQALAICLGE